MSEVIKIGIRRGPGENSYSLMIGDSTAHDISMDEALGLVKEEMEKLREGEEGMKWLVEELGSRIKADVRFVKEFAREELPAHSTLRAVILAEPDTMGLQNYVKKIILWDELLRKERR